MENQLELPLDDYHKIKALYNEYSSNHPVMHCNRFASWEELSEEYRGVMRSFLTTTPKQYWYD